MSNKYLVILIRIKIKENIVIKFICLQYIGTEIFVKNDTMRSYID